MRIDIELTSSINEPRVARGVALLLCCAAFISGCVSPGAEKTGERPRGERERTLVDRTVSVLEEASRAFEIARAAGDAPAMVRAALQRLEVSNTRLSESAATRLSEKTLEMIRLARIVAADNTQMQTEIDRILSAIDLDPEQRLSRLGNLGNFTGALKSQRLTTYTLAATHSRHFQVGVSSDNGAIVYVEAPAGSGVTLRVVEENEAPVCSDSSRHGMLICRWRPSDDGIAKIILHNASAFEVPVLMITNASILPGD